LTELKDSESVESLVSEALTSGVPIVAVLGQYAGWSVEHPDPVLTLALKKAGREGDDWKALLAREQLPATFYEWLAERFSRRAPSDELLAVADTPVSAVFTSSIDPGVINVFTTNGREPEPVLVGDPTPSVARSKRRPPVFYLFGRAGVGSPDFQPPPNSQSLAQRRLRHATAMLRAVNEAATAVGLIVIDGYRPESDWLKAEDLLAVIGTSPKGSVLWCGPEPTLSEDELETYLGLRADGVILRDSRSFGQLMALLRAQGNLSTSQHWDDPEIVSLAGGKKLVTSARLRLATQASATIVDDSLSGFLPPLSSSLEQSAFVNFHAVPSGIRSRIEGVRRGFAIVREFEAELTERVSKALTQHHLEPGAVILHGQSGIGKSVALARLASVIKERGTAAVLVASERMVQPTDVSDFLAEIDRLGAVTLLIVDVTLSPARFDDLLHSLRSRGHRVVVVGSSYRVEAGAASGGSGRKIAAPAELSGEEQTRLTKLAAHFSPASTVSATQPHALARFYWDLPGSREHLSRGLGQEARATEIALRSRGMARRPVREIGDIGAALIRAGYAAPTATVLRDSNSDLDSPDANSAAGRVIDYVMAVSRLYKAVPVNLLLHAVMDKALTSEEGVGIDVIRDLFQDQDMFRWYFGDDEGEELLVGARLQLEAELICNRRMGGPQGETVRLLELVRSSYRAGPEGHEETKFLTDIVYAMGPDGPFSERYKDSYADLARALSTLRERNGVFNARLMLQEATLRRHYIRTNTVPREEKTILLDEASRAVDEALQAIARTSGRRLYASRRTKDNLWVERAATYGYLATDSAQRNDSPEEIWASYRAARDAVRMATGRVDTYFPLDIALWMPLQILREAPNLRDVDRAELEADVRSSLDAVEPTSLPSDQFERFQRQRLGLGEILHDGHLSEAAFAQLATAGSSVGYYLRARAMAPSRPDRGEQADSEQQKAAGVAKGYLWDHYDRVATDPRSLVLLLGCEWVAATGLWLFRGSRQPLPSSTEVRTRCRSILLDLFAATPDQAQPKYRYLENVLNWLTNDEMGAIVSWRELARDTEYVEQGRVINRHIVADDTGNARLFTGVVERQIGTDRWSVLVADLGRHVDFVEAPLSRTDVRLGQSIRNFAIAFNYIGPIVDFAPARSGRP
jgi:hypothetical protein